MTRNPRQKYRTERDSLGEVRVPAAALWGPQTQRAVENFPISGLRLPRPFIRALGLIKGTAASVNHDLGLLDKSRAEAIRAASDEVSEGKHDEQFPVDVFQTGSGTSTNMNANEIIARLAGDRLRVAVHPHDHVNLGQSSNDVIPSAIHVSTSLEVAERLLPALRHLRGVIEKRASELKEIVKTGRTHLMDAMPVRMDQELGAWATQVRKGCERIEGSMPNIHRLAQGGTAVGTGIQTHEEFAQRFADLLSRRTGIDFRPSEDHFENLSCQDAAVSLSGQLKVVAVSLLKITNDLRLMNSGPIAGLGEISLPALQPGSSIMPGKINPVIPEAIAMVAAQVIGNDTTITIAGQSGSFQLNTMLPIIGYDLLQSVAILASGAQLLADKAIADFTVDRTHLSEPLAKNPMLATALVGLIGHDEAAKIAVKAYTEGRPILEVAKEETSLSESSLARLLDPTDLTRGGMRR
jgi:fumarate hydratase class II